MSTSWEPLPSIDRSKQEVLASLPPWRRLLQKLNLRHQLDPSALNVRRVRDVIVLLEEYGCMA